MFLSLHAKVDVRMGDRVIDQSRLMHVLITSINITISRGQSPFYARGVLAVHLERI